uniref:Glutaredoxin domain-containing protein n=1 Tax=Strongyloides papillosus TaxID=174720 RepID=A0A0N5CIH9_STREA
MVIESLLEIHNLIESKAPKVNIYKKIFKSEVLSNLIGEVLPDIPVIDMKNAIKKEMEKIDINERGIFFLSSEVTGEEQKNLSETLNLTNEFEGLKLAKNCYNKIEEKLESLKKEITPRSTSTPIRTNIIPLMSETECSTARSRSVSKHSIISNTSNISSINDDELIANTTGKEVLTFVDLEKFSKERRACRIGIKIVHDSEKALGFLYILYSRTQKFVVSAKYNQKFGRECRLAQVILSVSKNMACYDTLTVETKSRELFNFFGTMKNLKSGCSAAAKRDVKTSLKHISTKIKTFEMVFINGEMMTPLLGHISPFEDLFRKELDNLSTTEVKREIQLNDENICLL